LIDLYYWPTPNGRKISIMLEECGLDYTAKAVDIGGGEQFDPDFLKLSPNHRMPAIFDHATGVSVFEGGAILIYLAEKAGRFLQQDTADRFEVLQWLFWQAGGLGPIAGQLSHFVSYAKEPVPYAHRRYADEYDRLLAVMDVRLRERECIAGDYSIADMASYPWVNIYERLQQDLGDYPNLQRWYEQIRVRPATISAFEKGAAINTLPTVTEESKKILLGQSAETLAA
jgi:GST-like protein